MNRRTRQMERAMMQRKYKPIMAGKWSGTFVLTRSLLRKMTRLVYGWRAKGPIRKRALQKLWRASGWQG